MWLILPPSKYRTRKVLNYKRFKRMHIRWWSMIDRCTNPRNQRWKDYGGRGITVCERWRKSFDDFFDDMGEAPPGLWLDRRDNNGNYEPENCRWVTPSVSATNQRKGTKPRPKHIIRLEQLCRACRKMAQKIKYLHRAKTEYYYLELISSKKIAGA